MEERTKYKFQIISIILIFLAVSSSFYITYVSEQDDFLKGKAEFQLSYNFKLQNTGPLNLSSLNLRIAILKSWDPVQVVSGMKIHEMPNDTYSDEYNNTYAQYDYENFEVNQTLDLLFEANLTLNLLDYSGFGFKKEQYDIEDPEYKLYTRYDELADTTDVATINIANKIIKHKDPIDIAYDAYNFTSTYLNYRLLSTTRGSSFALRNGYGDCDEFTNLFIALVRSYGIPSVEHTAWLADFTAGFSTTDEGAAAHAYPMFILPGYGFLPADPTRGNTDIFGNFLKTDEKRITLTRGPDQPYRSLKYRWVPVEGVQDPLVISNYTINVKSMQVNYFSNIRKLILITIIAIPILFTVYNLVKGYKLTQKKKKEIAKILDPEISHEAELY